MLGEGVNPIVGFQKSTVPVHETSLANQHFIVHFWVGEGYVKRVLSVCL